MVPDDFDFDPTALNRTLGFGDDPDRAVLPTDARILWPLAHQLITCSEGQLLELFPDAPETGRPAWKKRTRPLLKDRTERLVRAGLIAKTDVRIRPHRKIEEPLFDWKQTDSQPNSREIADRIQEGWLRSTDEGHRSPPSSVFRISDPGAAAMGAFAGETNSAELKRYGLRATKLACAEHRIVPPGGSDPSSQQAVSEVYMARLWQSRDLVRGWRLLHRTPTALLLPDALVCDRAGKLLCAIVYATHWCPCVVERFHDLCSSLGAAYQIYGA